MNYLVTEIPVYQDHTAKTTCILKPETIGFLEDRMWVWKKEFLFHSNYQRCNVTCVGDIDYLITDCPSW